MSEWSDKETQSCQFQDKRIGDRFRQILAAVGSLPGESIPQACQNWAETKAVYRFLSNERVNAQNILSGHIHETSKRITACEGPVLVLHDTCEFIFKRKDPKPIGSTRKLPSNERINGAFGLSRTACGCLLHASLAITPEGLPLGLTASHHWSRKEFKNTTAMKKKVNPTRVPISTKESQRWLDNISRTHEVTDCDAQKLVHVGDREADIYELFSLCAQLNTYFLVRVCVNRLADESTLSEEIALSKKRFSKRIKFDDAKGNKVSTRLGVKVKKLLLHPPTYKTKEYDDLDVTVVSAVEEKKPADRDRIRWTLITNLPVTTKADALNVLHWYKERWKIEVYFKVLKSGLGLESSKLRERKRLERWIALCCLVGWRIQWLTMLARESDTFPETCVFSKSECLILKRTAKLHDGAAGIKVYLYALAMLGGYLNRTKDPPPGIVVIWRGVRRLSELRQGYEMAFEKDMGN